jgi:hypothetical protein
MRQKLFRGVKYAGELLWFFDGAQYEEHSIDVLANEEMLSDRELYIARMAEVSGSPLPPVQEVADSMLNAVMGLAWPNGLPKEISELITGRKTVTVSAHGSNYPGIGWGIHVVDDIAVPVPRVVEQLVSEGYETLVLALCNPQRQRLTPSAGAVIYPLGMIAFGSHEFTMVYNAAQTPFPAASPQQ